jgi:hypothetical protein
MFLRRYEVVAGQRKEPFQRIALPGMFGKREHPGGQQELSFIPQGGEGVQHHADLFAVAEFSESGDDHFIGRKP